MKCSTAWVCACALFLAACGTPASDPAVAAGALPVAAMATGAPAALTTCAPHPFVPGARVAFEHARSSLLVASGADAHSMQDLLVVEGAPVVAEAKIAYGAVSKDLEDETVRGWIDTCDGWLPLGEARTDGDGRARFTLKRAIAPGRYALRAEVAGDGTGADAWLWVVARGTRLAVFDIDGTLTTSDEELVRDVRAELFAPLLGGTYLPELYPGAVALSQATALHGWTNVYLTGRPYWLTKMTRAWIASSGVAPGVLHTTDSNPEALTTESGVGDYKMAFLKKLLAAGLVVDAAHGNAATDVYAYLGAGLPPAQVWIIGPHGGERGTNAVGTSWEKEVVRIRSLPHL
jgi:hypothetical protein